MNTPNIPEGLTGGGGDPRGNLSSGFLIVAKQELGTDGLRSEAWRVNR